MKLSGWARLWIVTPLLGGCYLEEHPDTIRTNKTIQKFDQVCERYLSTVRPSWETEPANELERRERAAIQEMRKACHDLEVALSDGWR